MKSEIKKVKFKDDQPLQIEVVDLAELMRKHAGLITVPHCANFYHVFLFQNCRPVHLVDFNPVKIKQDSLLFINKDSVHRFDKAANYRGKCLIFTDDFFA